MLWSENIIERNVFQDFLLFNSSFECLNWELIAKIFVPQNDSNSISMVINGAVHDGKENNLREMKMFSSWTQAKKSEMFWVQLREFFFPFFMLLSMNEKKNLIKFQLNELLTSKKNMFVAQCKKNYKFRKKIIKFIMQSSFRFSKALECKSKCQVESLLEERLIFRLPGLKQLCFRSHKCVDIYGFMAWNEEGRKSKQTTKAFCKQHSNDSMTR